MCLFYSFLLIICKVRSGTFGVIYVLHNAKREHMLLAPMMARLKTGSMLTQADIRPSREGYLAILHQFLIHIVKVLPKYLGESFPDVEKDDELQYRPRRPLPIGHRTRYYPLSVAPIEEASVDGNLDFHEEMFIRQLKQTPEKMSLWAVR